MLSWAKLVNIYIYFFFTLCVCVGGGLLLVVAMIVAMLLLFSYPLLSFFQQCLPLSWFLKKSYLIIWCTSLLSGVFTLTPCQLEGMSTCGQNKLVKLCYHPVIAALVVSDYSDWTTGNASDHTWLQPSCRSQFYSFRSCTPDPELVNYGNEWQRTQRRSIPCTEGTAIWAAAVCLRSFSVQTLVMVLTKDKLTKDDSLS